MREFGGGGESELWALSPPLFLRWLMTEHVALKRTNDTLPAKGFWCLDNGSPLIACGNPDCSGHHNLRAWNVDNDGNVTPSVLHKGKCGWHAMVKLEGWP